MDQLHRRLTIDQVRVLLQGYCDGTLTRAEAQEMLGLRKTRFFAVLQAYRLNPTAFSITYDRETPARLSPSTERAIETELRREQKLIEDPRLPISDYNNSAIRDRLERKGAEVTARTITDLAKKLGCYRPHPKGKAHDRQVVTAAIGALVQHDASSNLWSPFATEKWTLITSLDDFSRKMLFGDFFAQETAWTHIQAAQILMQTYGLPLRYYVDNLRVFRFVQRRDSHWRKQVLETDDVDPQWRQVLRLLGVDVTYALSPQAKGRVERMNETLQDRLVKEMRLANISGIAAGKAYVPTFIADLNMRFAVVPRNAEDAHRPLLPQDDLARILTVKETRVLSKNLTLNYRTVIYQIQTPRPTYALRSATVVVRENAQGEVAIEYKDKPLAYTIYRPAVHQAEVITSKQLAVPLEVPTSKKKPRKPQVPAADDPWRQYKVRG